MSESKTPACPHCGKAFGAEMVARLADESRITWSLTPSPGEFMSAESVGGSLAALAQLLKEIGKNVGCSTEIVVERMETDEGGKITARLRICRWELAKARRARINAEKRAAKVP